VLSSFPRATAAEVDLVRTFVASYCESELAARLAALPGVRTEPHFAFEHDGVVLHGFLDALHEADGRALVVDYKSNVVGDESPAEIVERDYRLQRLVYALALFRAGAGEVEVVYQFLEDPDAVVSTRYDSADVAELEAELTAAIARIQAGAFRPTPGELVCATCPALDVICAGPRLRGAPASAAAFALAT